MVCCGESHYPDVGGEAIQFVKEERAVLWCQLRIQVLKHEDAGGRLAGTVEHLVDIELVSSMRGLEASHVETGLLPRVNNGLDRVCLAVACRADKQDAALPGDVIFFIDGTCRKKLLQIIAYVLLETAAQDQVIERRSFNVLEEVLVFVPTRAIKHQH